MNVCLQMRLQKIRRVRLVISILVLATQCHNSFFIHLNGYTYVTRDPEKQIHHALESITR